LKGSSRQRRAQLNQLRSSASATSLEGLVANRSRRASLIRQETGATVLLPHHVSKGGITAGAERIDQSAVRGASALVDGARWVMAMAGLRRDVAQDFGISPEEAGMYARLELVKANPVPPWPGLWVRRGVGGVLQPTTLERCTEGTRAARADHRYTEVAEKLVALVKRHQDCGTPLTRNRLRDFAGRSGPLGVGDQTLRGIVERAIQDGRIREHQGDRSKELRTW